MTEVGVSTATRKALDDRIHRLRASLVSSPYEGDIERARLVTRSYRQTEGMPPCMRAARALQETLRHVSIRIEPDERLVGAKTIKKVAGPIGIERSTSANRVTAIGLGFHGKSQEDLAFLDVVGMTSPSWMRELLNMPEQELAEMKDDILPYWKGKDMSSLMRAGWREAGLVSVEQPTPIVAGVADMQGHVTFGLEKVLDLGFDGIARQAADRLAELETQGGPDAMARDFLESVGVAAAAVREHTERYAALAEQLAHDATPQRAAELLEIADRCRRVPASPPATFADAVQATWMTQVVLALSYGEDAIFAPGRVDQCLYPYYREDRRVERVTRAAALELLEEYLIKLSTFTGFGPNNLTIGGVDRSGGSAVNEVSYLVLEAFDRLKGIRNGLAVRYNEACPRDFLVAACAAHRKTAGIAFYGDDRVIQDLTCDGYSLEDARDYAVVGCAELTSTGNNNGYASGSTCHFERVLELALNEGRCFAARWQQVGVATPPAADLESFEAVQQAFRDQLANSVERMVRLSDVKDAVFAEHFPTPLISSTIEGCVESGRDITQGGATYNHSTVSAQGLATVANSLAAIRWAVYEQKLLSLQELVAHTRNNFEGAEELRQTLLRKAPKIGTNDQRADALAAWVAGCLNEEARKHRRPIDGGPYRALMISAGTQAAGGFTLGATPDGRLARQPVSNGASPANGTEVEGMTAALHSAARIAAAVPLSGGTAMNMNLNPLAIRTDEALEKLVALLEGYFALGGRQIQFNPMSKETLKDAQAHPENYPDLMVKVSGYSYRYVDLSKVLQDDIINRTEFSL